MGKIFLTDAQKEQCREKTAKDPARLLSFLRRHITSL